jgi:hypothetical protein
LARGYLGALFPWHVRLHAKQFVLPTSRSWIRYVVSRRLAPFKPTMGQASDDHTVHCGAVRQKLVISATSSRNYYNTYPCSVCKTTRPELHCSRMLLKSLPSRSSQPRCQIHVWAPRRGHSRNRAAVPVLTRTPWAWLRSSPSLGLSPKLDMKAQLRTEKISDAQCLQIRPVWPAHLFFFPPPAQPSAYRLPKLKIDDCSGRRCNVIFLSCHRGIAHGIQHRAVDGLKLDQSARNNW